MRADVGLVCFDLGRVLLRICDDWRHACRLAGVAAPEGEPDLGAKLRLHELVCRVEVGAIDHHAFCNDSAAIMGVSPGDVSAMSDAYLIGPYPGTAELLQELRSAGVTTACLSNTNARHWQLMNDPSSAAHLPLGMLTHAFASHLVRLRKPDDALYAHVERATGVPASGIVFFDDVAENVEAARRRGWRGHLVRPPYDDPITGVRAALVGEGLSLGPR